jgi:hypothetical protein
MSMSKGGALRARDNLHKNNNNNRAESEFQLDLNVQRVEKEVMHSTYLASILLFNGFSGGGRSSRRPSVNDPCRADCSVEFSWTRCSASVAPSL